MKHFDLKARRRATPSRAARGTRRLFYYTCCGMDDQRRPDATRLIRARQDHRALVTLWRIGGRAFSLTAMGLVVGACAAGASVGNVRGSPAATVELAAENLAFDRSSVRFPAGVVVALTLDNRDPGILHNVAIYPSSGGDPVFRGETFTGIQTETYLVGPLPAGSFRFVCDVHPTMSGTLTVATPPP